MWLAADLTLRSIGIVKLRWDKTVIVVYSFRVESQEGQEKESKSSSN